MRITFLQFIVDVPSLGSFWSADKHSKEWTVEEKGSWFVLTSNVSGQRRRIPITSVACINEVPTEDKPAKGGAK